MGGKKNVFAIFACFGGGKKKKESPRASEEEASAPNSMACPATGTECEAPVTEQADAAKVEETTQPTEVEPSNEQTVDAEEEPAEAAVSEE